MGEPPVVIGMVLNEGDQWKIVATVTADVASQIVSHYDATGTFGVINDRVTTTYVPVALAVWGIVDFHVYQEPATAEVVPSEVGSSDAESNPANG